MRTSIIYRLNATVAEDGLTGLMNLFGLAVPERARSDAIRAFALFMSASAGLRA